METLSRRLRKRGADPLSLEHQSEDGAAGGRRVSRPSASDESQQAVTNEIGRSGQSVVRPFKGDRGRSDGRRPIRFVVLLLRAAQSLPSRSAAIASR